MARRTFIIRLAFHYTIPIYNKYTEFQRFTQNGKKNHKKQQTHTLKTHKHTTNPSFCPILGITFYNTTHIGKLQPVSNSTNIYQYYNRITPLNSFFW